MKNLKFFSIFLVLVFVVSFWTPAMVTPGQAAGLQATVSSGASISLTITNPLPKATTISLSGPKSYTINVPQGATITRIIDSGNYKYSYLGCLNKAKTGNFKSKGATATLKIAPCKMATWVWYNADDSKPATIRLKGWVNYSVTVGPGQVLSFSWVADRYQFTLVACGKTINETLNVKGKKSWVIYACK